MSVLFTDVMTVYNYHRDTETEKETWNLSVVRGVQWTQGKRQIRVVNGVATETTSEIISIDFMRSYPGNKTFMDSTAYSQLSGEEAAKYWTLNSQDGMDVIVCGEIDREITPGYRIKTLKKDYAYVGTVSEVADHRNRPRLKNIKVVLK